MNHKKRQKKGRYNFLIDASVYDEFSQLCDELGIIRSKSVENHMKEFIKKRKELLKKEKE